MISVLAVYVDATVIDADTSRVKEAAAKCGARFEKMDGVETSMRGQLEERSAVHDHLARPQPDVRDAKSLTTDLLNPFKAATNTIVGARRVSGSTWEDERNCGFRFVLVLSLGERGLSAALLHYDIAGVDLFAVRNKIAADLARCLTRRAASTPT